MKGGAWNRAWLRPTGRLNSAVATPQHQCVCFDPGALQFEKSIARRAEEFHGTDIMAIGTGMTQRISAAALIATVHLRAGERGLSLSSGGGWPNPISFPATTSHRNHPML